MALDPTKALPGTLVVDLGGDTRGGGNYPEIDAGRPMTVTWEELYGVSGGATFSDVSAVGTGAKTLTADSIALKNGLCDVELVPGQGTKVIKVTVVGCQG
jgi:hypothetical protein